MPSMIKIAELCELNLSIQSESSAKPEVQELTLRLLKLVMMDQYTRDKIVNLLIQFIITTDLN